MSKRELTEYERKARRDKALKPLPRCLLWAEAERLRGEAFMNVVHYGGVTMGNWRSLCRLAADPNTTDVRMINERGKLFVIVEKMARRTELEQRKLDHYTAETKRLRAQAREQGAEAL